MGGGPIGCTPWGPVLAGWVGYLTDEQGRAARVIDDAIEEGPVEDDRDRRERRAARRVGEYDGGHCRLGAFFVRRHEGLVNYLIDHQAWIAGNPEQTAVAVSSER